MNILKTTLVAGALAIATLATTAADAASFGVFVGRDNFGLGLRAGQAHRGFVPAHYGNWYAASFRPYAYYRAHPRTRACFPITKHGFHNGRHVLIGATMCYGKNGARFVVPTSRHVVRWY